MLFFTIVRVLVLTSCQLLSVLAFLVVTPKEHAISDTNANATAALTQSGKLSPHIQPHVSYAYVASEIPASL
jgi:hypothetical protein